MKSKLAACMALAVALVGCATEYRPKDDGGGYSETALAPGLWRVKFDYTRYTQPQQVEDFSLLRSAELTLQQGYSHFSLSDPQSMQASSEVLVRMFHNQPKGLASIYDARAVCSKLGDWYQERCRAQ